MGSRKLHGFDAAPRLYRLVTVCFEKIVEQLHVQLIVFNDENALLHGLSLFRPAMIGSSI
jgi:hypothetical protein